MDFFCRVLTPYYTEEVLFSLNDLDSQNEDGVSILFYLQKIFPGSSLTPNLCRINVKLREIRNVMRLLIPFWLLMHR